MSLATLVATPGPLAIAAEIVSADANTTVYVSDVPLTTDSTSTPASTTFAARLLEAPSYEVAIDWETLHEQVLATVSRQRMVIDDRALSTTAGDKAIAWEDTVWQGGTVTVKVGRPPTGVTPVDYDTFEVFGTWNIRSEPVRDSKTATFELGSAAETSLARPLAQRRWLGQPTAIETITGTTTATAAYNAAYDVTSFTLSAYIWAPAAAPAATQSIFEKQLSATNNNFTLVLRTDGLVKLTSSIAGASGALSLTSTTDITDAADHHVLVSVSDQNTAYIMIDGTVEETVVPSGVVDTQMAAIKLMGDIGSGFTATTRLKQWTVLNAYVPPNEARALFGQRFDPADSRCIAHFRANDKTGATLTDSSATANNATLAGVENTDWKWVPDNGGEAALAGVSYPVTYGYVQHAPTVISDTATADNGRFRVSTGRPPSRGVGSTPPLSTEFNRVPYAAGVALTITTEYLEVGEVEDAGAGALSNDDDVIELINSPGTDRLTWVATDAGNLTVSTSSVATVGRIFEDVLADHTARTDTNVTHRDWPLRAAIYESDPGGVTALDILEQLGRGVVRIVERRNGGIVDVVPLPPFGAGPYSHGWVRGAGQLNLSASYNMTGSFTAFAWVSTATAAALAYEGDDRPQELCLVGSQGGLQIVGTAARLLCTTLTPASLTSPPGVINPLERTFIAGRYDSVAQTLDLWVASATTAFRKVATATGVTGTFTASGSTVRFGPYNPGATTDLGAATTLNKHMAQGTAAIFDAALSDATIEGYFTTEPTTASTNIHALWTADGTWGDAISELVVGGSQSGGFSFTWLPAWEADFELLPEEASWTHRKLRAAGEIELRFRKNHAQLDNADIAASATDADRAFFTRPHEVVAAEVPTIKAASSDWRSILMDTALAERQDAVAVSALALEIYAAPETVVLSGLPETALFLEPLIHEIQVTNAETFVDGYYRVYSVNANPETKTVDVVGFR